MICKLFLQVILDDEIQIIRVPLSHGALCRTTLFESAGSHVLPMQNLPRRGLIARLPTASSRMNDSASDSARCLASYRRVRVTVSRWSAKTGQTRRPRYYTGCGILMHSSLAVTTEGLPLGLTAIKFWSRKKFKVSDALKRRINPTRVPIEKKESIRWLDNL